MNRSKKKSSGVQAWTVLLGTIVGLGVILAALLGWDYMNTKGDVPRGTSVGGVKIGGMNPTEAVAELEHELGDVASQEVTATAGSTTATFVPSEVGLDIDYEATVEAAGSESMNPVERLRGLFSTIEVPVVSVVDEGALGGAVNRLSDELGVKPVDGAVEIEDGKVKTHEPKDGQRVEGGVLAEAMKEDWLDPAGVKVEPEVVTPAIGSEALDAVAKGPAAAAVSGPIVVHGSSSSENSGDAEGRIEPERMHEVVTFTNNEGRIEPHVNVDAAREILAEGLAESESEGRNAKVLSGGGVEPHVDGHVVDWDATLEGFEGRVLSKDDREFDATYKNEPASFTTEEAQNATFNEVVGAFTTSDYSEASGKNISVIASAVDGTIVNPGETFSLNGATSPRGLAQGYVESGIILNGRSDKGVGGGVSQFATTLYNAAYFAGLEDVTHTPHSYYISRYPAGREATIFDGAIDLAFKNNSDHPVLIDTSVGGGSVTVQLLGVKTVDVQSVSGGRWAQTEPQEIRVSDDSCVPSNGAPGFTTSDTRIISDLSGNEINRETQTTVYDPQPIVRCG